MIVNTPSLIREEQLNTKLKYLIFQVKPDPQLEKFKCWQIFFDRKCAILTFLFTELLRIIKLCNKFKIVLADLYKYTVSKV